VDAAGVVLSDQVARTDSLLTYRWDVTALLNACPAGAPCVLALYNVDGAHFGSHGGTATLLYECGGPLPVCGDGFVEGAETCDDGNVNAGDGCSAACAVELGYTCAGEPSMCSTTCGDGFVEGSEQCDDGNVASGDGCSSACVAEVCTCAAQ
jgi:cysteine-rich repeat protein